MEWINKKLMTWGGPVNLLATIANSLVAFLGKIYENRKVWVIVGLGIFATVMGLLRMWIDKLLSDDKSKMETDLRATIDRLTDLNEELIHRNKELISEVRSLKDEVKSLRNEINSMQTTIYNQSSKIDSMQTTIDNQSSKIDSMQTTINNQSSKIDSMQTTIDNQSSKIDSLESNVGDVKESSNETRDVLTTKMETLESTVHTNMRQMQDAIMEMQPSDYQYQELVDAEIETHRGH